MYRNDANSTSQSGKNLQKNLLLLDQESQMKLAIKFSTGPHDNTKARHDITFSHSAQHRTSTFPDVLVRSNRSSLRCQCASTGSHLQCFAFSVRSFQHKCTEKQHSHQITAECNMNATESNSHNSTQLKSQGVLLSS